MKIRNARSLNFAQTQVEMEVKHPEFGWVPFTWCADPSEAGADTYGLADAVQAEIAGGRVAVQAYAPIAPTPEQIAAEARAYLASTDWYVVRRAETGEPIPQEVADKRAAARAAANV